MAASSPRSSSTGGRSSVAILRTIAMMVSTRTGNSSNFSSNCWRSSVSLTSATFFSSEARSIFNPVRPWPSSSCTSRAMRVRSSSRTDCKYAARARNCSRESRNCFSARLRSVMSRTKPVNIAGPSRLTLVIANSTGNSLPSARMAIISTRLPSIVAWPPARKRSRPRRCLSRSEGGMRTSASSLPMTSARARPKIFSAAGLNSVMRPRSLMVMMASNAEFRMEPLRASLSRSDCSASLRVVMSSRLPS